MFLMTAAQNQHQKQQQQQQQNQQQQPQYPHYFPQSAGGPGFFRSQLLPTGFFFSFNQQFPGGAPAAALPVSPPAQVADAKATGPR